MAKKKAAKPSVKKPSKPEPKKEIKQPVKKDSRGVKAGTKRGSYKKQKKLTTESFVVNAPETTEPELKPVEQVQEPAQEQKPEIKESAPSSLSGEEKYSKFLQEYGQPKEIVDNSQQAQPDDKQKQAEEHKNKEYDFTNTASASTSSSPSSSSPLEENKNSMKSLVNGYMLLALCDFIVPNAIIWIYKRVDSRAEKINVSDVKLDEDQRNALMASADQCAAYIFQHINPLAAFFIGMSVMYASNIQSELKKIPRETKRRREKVEPEPPYMVELPDKPNKNSNNKKK